MLTPDFKLTQNESSIVIVIRLPYVKISSCEFFIEAFNFKFYLKPYLLSLTFQQQLLQAEQPHKATYYHEKHLLEVTLLKKTSGEHFENLNLLSSVLNKNKNKAKKKTLIEVVNEPGSVVVDSAVEQTVSPYAYGFCRNYTNVFDKLEEQCYQILSFNPAQVCIADRYELSQKLAQSFFDLDAYLFDNQDNEEIPSILSSKESKNAIKAMLEKTNCKDPQSFQQFKSALSIPNKQLIVPESQMPSIINQLVSICLCFLYELQCMDGELSVESAKTINNTSAILSCCMDYEQVEIGEIVKDCARRCVVYSLYKSVPIFNKASAFLAEALNKELIWTILVEIRTMFQKSDPRYLLNTIYLDDYLVYTSKKIKDEDLMDVKAKLKSMKMTEQMLGLPLEQDLEQLDEDEAEEEEQEQGDEKQENEEQSIPPSSFSKKGPLIVELNSQETADQVKN